MLTAVLAAVLAAGSPCDSQTTTQLSQEEAAATLARIRAALASKPKRPDQEHIEGKVAQLDTQIRFFWWGNSVGTFTYDRSGDHRLLVWKTEKWDFMFIDDGTSRAEIRTPAGKEPGASSSARVRRSSPATVAPIEDLLFIPDVVLGHEVAGLVSDRGTEPARPAAGEAAETTCDSVSKECVNGEELVAVGCHHPRASHELVLWFDPTTHRLRGWRAASQRAIVDGGTPWGHGEDRLDGRAFQVLITSRRREREGLPALPGVGSLIEQLASAGAVSVQAAIGCAGWSCTSQ
jgi:hypothetical protein